MASAVTSGAGNNTPFYAKIYTPSEDWKTIEVQRRDGRGKICNSNVGIPQKFKYTLEVSTGDLYGLSGDPDPIYVVAAKAFSIFLIAPYYMAGLMCANCVKIAVDLSSIFWKIIPQMIADISKKGVIDTLANGFLAVVYEIPKEIVLDVWRICRAPIFAVGIMFASLYALVSPYEGRKWIGKIENEWHEGIRYQMNLNKKNDPDKFYTEIAQGKVLFLAICMQKMGNINDKIGGFDKFEIYKP